MPGPSTARQPRKNEAPPPAKGKQIRRRAEEEGESSEGNQSPDFAGTFLFFRRRASNFCLSPDSAGAARGGAEARFDGASRAAVTGRDRGFDHCRPRGGDQLRTDQ